jgi:AraC family transcriptional regulator
VDSLEDPARGDELAHCAYLSRFHFDRLVAAGLGEAPAEFRRLLLLERAANAAGLRSVSCASDTSGAGREFAEPSVESATGRLGHRLRRRPV